MTLRPVIQIIFLIAAMQLTSAYKFRCWFFCSDQTAVQNDYVQHRDECRKYAQLRIDTDTANPELMDDKARKGKLVSLFSSCMADKGWTVPDGKGSQQASAPVPVSATPTPAAPVIPPAAVNPVGVPANAITTQQGAAEMEERQRQKKYLARQSECAFARHGAAYSTASAARADACDAECTQRRKIDPNGTMPASCPDSTSDITNLNQGK